MAAIVESLLSVFLTILLGYGLRRWLVSDRAVWAGLERLAYYALLPALLVHSLATAEFALAAAWRLILSVLGTILLTGGLAFLLRRAVRLSGPQFAAVFQGATRLNSYVVLGVSGTLLGTAGVALASLALAVMIVVVNVMAVGVLVRYGERPEHGAGKRPPLLASLAGNPLILACVVGVAVNLSGLTLPPLIDKPLGFIGSAALGIALLAVGAALAPRRLFADLPAVSLTCALKLIGQPAIFLGLAAGLALDGQATLVGMICAAVPIATSAYIMTAQLGGDADLMARLITVTTLGATVTMLPWLLLAASPG